MADRFWRGGTDNWNATAGTKWASTVGGSGGAAVPTSADDVYLDATSGSGTVTIPNGMSCRSLNCTGFTGTLVLASGVFYTIGDGTAGASNVALKFDSGMTLTTAFGSTAIFTFNYVGSTAQTITFGGKGMTGLAEWRFQTAGKWRFTDTAQLSTAFNNSSAQITHTSGTVELADGITLTLGKWSSTGSTARTLTLGSGSTINQTWTTWTMSGSNNTITSNSATWNFQTALSISGSGINMNGTSMTMTGAGIYTLATAGTWANITRTGTAINSDQLAITGTGPTVTGTFTVTGNSAVNRVWVTGSYALDGIGPIAYATGTGATITAAAVSLTNVDFSDITGAGAATWSGTTVGDCLGNSNITFTTPVSRYAKVAGNFSSTATWSATDGGSAGASIPLPQDSVYLTANAGAGTYTVDVARFGSVIDCTGFTRTLSFTSAHTMTFGSVTWASGMTLNGTRSLRLSGRGSHTITSNGKSWGATQAVLLTSVGGAYTQADALTTGGAFEPLSGTYGTAGYALTCSAFGQSPGTATLTLNLSTSTITMTGTSGTILTLASSGLTWNGSSAAFVISAASASTRTFAGGGKTFGSLTYTVSGSTGQLTITGANTFGTLNFSDATNARTLILPSSTTTTFTSAFNVQGTSGKLMTVNSSTSGTAATISKSFGTILCDYLSLKDLTATGGALWYAGGNSTNTSGNTGWSFTTPYMSPTIMMG